MRVAALVVCLCTSGLALPAWAACTGSSPTWTTTPDFVSVSACVGNALRGDTINVLGGTATWTSGLTVSRGVHIVGAGRDAATIRSGVGPIVNIAPDANAIANSEVIRVSGLTLDGLNTASVIVEVHGAGAGATKPYRGLVLSDNRFANPSQTSSTVIYQSGQVRGVIASNLFERPVILARCFGSDTKSEFTNAAFFPFTLGSADNLFYEDNIIQWTTAGGASGFAGWVECGQGGRVVWRYNTWNFANASGQDETWDVHGFQNWSAGSGGQTGTQLVEYYGNTMLQKAGYRNLFHRGGQGLYFNNVISGSSGSGADVANHNAGCHNDIDATWPPPFVQTNNVYYWNNTNNGASTTLVAYPNADNYNGDCPPLENVHFWNLSAACTASACPAGVGRGSAPPTGTCAPGTGYWVASVSTPTTSPAVTQGGTLYRCSPANVWSVFYTPYVYPHPLRSTSTPDGGSGGGSGGGGNGGGTGGGSAAGGSAAGGSAAGGSAAGGSAAGGSAAGGSAAGGSAGGSGGGAQPGVGGCGCGAAESSLLFLALGALVAVARRRARPAPPSL